MDISIIKQKQIIANKLKDECLFHLKNKYGLGVFDDEKIIEEQIKYVRDYYLGKFKDYIHSHRDVGFYYELIFLYKTLSDSMTCECESLTKSEKAGLKRILLLAIGEAVNLELIDNSKSQYSNDDILSVIIFLNEISFQLDEFSGGLYRFYHLGKDRFYFEITDYQFALTFSDISYGKQYNDFICKYSKGENAIKINSKEEDFLTFQDAVIDCFGEDCYSSLFGDIFEDTRLSNNKANTVYNLKEQIVKLSKSNSNFADTFILRTFDIDESLKKPHNENRLRYRPILELSINGEKEYLTSFQLIYGALCELASNRIPYGSSNNCLPKEWQKEIKMKKFAEKLSETKGKDFEKMLENYVSDKYIILTDIKDVNGIKIHNAQKGSTEEHVGQIDAIIFDVANKRLFVADCKNRKSRFDWASWSAEKDVYDSDSVKLTNKVQWICEHLTDTALELQKKKKVDIISDILDYQINSIFVVDTFTALSFNYSPKIVMMRELNEWLSLM